MRHGPTVVRARGWNTWDFRGFNRFAFLEEDRFALEVRVLFLDPIERELIEEFSWDDLRDVGPHAPDGSYTSCELQAGFEARFRIESAAEDDVLYLEIAATRPSGKRPVAEFIEPGSRRRRREGNRIHLGPWTVAVEGDRSPERVFVAVDHPWVVGDPGGRLRIAVGPREKRPDPARVPEAIAAARDRYARSRLCGTGILAGLPEAMIRGMTWNTVFDRSGRGVCTPVSRRWSRDWRGVLLFGWDSFLGGLMAATESPSLALANYRAVLAGTTEEGFVPNWRLSTGAYTADRSQPPVGALAVAQTAQILEDPSPYLALLPALIRWHLWWPERRDGNGDGLLEWGSCPDRPWIYPQLRQVLYGEQICACYESGMDNSPVFDGVPYDRRSGTLQQADVGLNALHAADAESILELGARAGDAEIDGMRRVAEGFRRRREQIDEALWSDEKRLWLNRGWDGVFSERIAPTSLYPLLCAIGASERREAAVETALTPDRLGGEWPLPSIARTDPAWRDNDYWRGRVWPPMNFLVLEGLRRCGFDDEADWLALRGLEMFRRGWEEDGRIYENYSSRTGEGGDVPNSDPLYTWGGLLCLGAVRRIVAPGFHGGLDLGCLGAEDAGVRNLVHRGDVLDVHAGPAGISVCERGDVLLETDLPMRIRGFDPAAPAGEVTVRGPRGARLRWRGLPAGSTIALRLNGRTVEKTVGRDGAVELRLP